MARKKVSAPQPYGSWDEADEALREIGELQRSIEAAEHEMQRQIDAAKEGGRKSLLLMIRRGGEPRFVALSVAE